MIITYRITKYLRSVDVHKEYKVYFLSVVTFSASFAVVNTAMMNDRTVDYFYLICKSLSMIVNIVLFGLIWHRIYRLMKTTSPKAQRQISVGATAPPMGSPVYALTTRYKRFQACRAMRVGSYACLCTDCSTTAWFKRALALARLGIRHSTASTKTAMIRTTQQHYKMYANYEYTQFISRDICNTGSDASSIHLDACSWSRLSACVPGHPT